MKVLVCGGRFYSNYDAVARELFKLGGASMVIHGGAKGADSLAGRWARENGIQEVIVPANWDYFGKAAGFLRNKAMLRLSPDIVIAFPGGKGTAHMVKTVRDTNANTEWGSFSSGIPIIEVIDK